MVFVITKVVCGFRDHQDCNLPYLLLWLWAFPSKCRGGYAIGFVGIPLSEEVIVGVLALRLIPLV